MFEKCLEVRVLCLVHKRKAKLNRAGMVNSNPSFSREKLDWEIQKHPCPVLKLGFLDDPSHFRPCHRRCAPHQRLFRGWQPPVWSHTSLTRTLQSIHEKTWEHLTEQKEERKRMVK